MIGKLPKFLIIRFAPGSAGNFLSSILQCSPEVSHWSEIEQNKKPNNDWLGYFKESFPTDLSQWLYHEPIGKLKWGTREIFSAKYPRGNDLDINRFLNLEEIYCNKYYHNQKNKGHLLPIFWHKEYMPEYFKNSKSIIIKLDKQSLRWYDHAVYYKHHKIIDVKNKKLLVQLLENRPEIIPTNFSGKNDFEKEWKNYRQFVSERIYENPFRHQYQHINSMKSWDIPSTIIKLSSILNQTQFYEDYIRLCQFLGITEVLSSKDIITLHQYWKNLHAF